MSHYNDDSENKKAYEKRLGSALNSIIFQKKNFKLINLIANKLTTVKVLFSG